MASVYILYSSKLNKYYIGSCLDLEARFQERINKSMPDAFTKNASDWVIYYSEGGLSYSQARAIEKQIKKMKPKDLVTYFGSKGNVSEFLNHKRKLSIRTIKALHEKLKLPYEVLLA